MAKGNANPAAGLGQAAKFTEVRQRLLFLIGALIVYRIGTFVPVPGIDPEALAQLFEQQSGTILSMFNMFSGGALERLSIFALGVMPYISASIIIQMATVVLPSLSALKKEGAATVDAYITHPVLSGSAVSRIDQSELYQMVVTDTIPLNAEESACTKIRQLTTAELLSETMRRISAIESVS